MVTLGCSDTEHTSINNFEEKLSAKSGSFQDLNTNEFKEFDDIFSNIMNHPEKFKTMNEKTTALSLVSKNY